MTARQGKKRPMPVAGRYRMQNLKRLPPEVLAAREHLRQCQRTCGYAARQLGCSKDLVKSVLTGRKRSARVLAGVLMLTPAIGAREFAAKLAAVRAA